VDIKKAKSEILLNYPDFEFENIKKLGEGMDSVAFLVNKNYIFRFPKNDDVRENLAKEIAALPILQTKLEIEIPNFEYVSKNNSFVGYRKIEGKFLTKELFNSFAENEQDEIQKSLADFLQTIHKQKVEEFVKWGVEIQDFRADYEWDFENIKEFVFPLISAKNADFISKQFRQYLETEENFSFEPVLLHNDLSPDHILIEPKTIKLVGIIDFGDIGIGDPDYDLIYFLDDYAEEFVRSFLRFYPHPNHEKLFEKLYFFGLVDTLQLISHYVENEEIDEIDELLEYLLEWIRKMEQAQ
jgi:aminoglycoside 2''-phosphotransferase